MYDYEIEDLLRLRNLGYSFGAIAKAMHVKKELLKKYCHDHGIVSDAPRKTKAENALLRNCKFCGRVIEPNTNGTTREFCSNTCRRKHWEQEDSNAPFDNIHLSIPKDTQRAKKPLAICKRKSDELLRKEVQNE